MKNTITCIECPIGCTIEVEVEDGKILSVVGNACPRGKMYAENEVICPKRVLTTTVRMQNGKLLSVKTDAPIEKSKTFAVMQTVNGVHPDGDIKIGDILVKDIVDGVNLVAADNAEYL